MTFHKFVSAIQAARGVLFGRMNELAAAPVSAPHSHWWDVARQTSDIWLTPNIVKEYDPADFQYSPADQQAEIRRAVDEFQKFVEGLHGCSPTDAQIQKGYELFATINAVIAPIVGEEPGLPRIVEAIRSVPWPDYVFGADCRLGLDSTGDPGVWIWFLVDDDLEIESLAVQDELNRVRLAYLDAIQKAGIERWPYTSVRTRSETKDLITGAA